MGKFKKIFPSLIFNLAETAIVILMGMLMKLPITYIIFVLLTFMISRRCFGEPLHYKTWYRCLIWSLLVMLSLFILAKINLPTSIAFAVFTAYIMTSKSNIKNMYLWKSNDEPSKYQDIIDYIKYNELDTKLLEFERKIKEKDNLTYLIYKYKFKDGKTFSEMSKLLDMDNPRIVEHLDRIAFAIRLYCGI